jgi:hypothetical protein
MSVANTSFTTGTGSFFKLSPRDTGLNRVAYIGSYAVSSSYSPPIVFGQQTGATSYAERMRIDENGNVGIGTAAPGATLAIYQPSSGTRGLLLSGNGIESGSVASNDGILLSLGYTETGNRQLWLGDSTQYGDNASSSFRYIVGFDVPIIDAISNDGADRRNLTLGALDTNVGIGFPALGTTQSSITAKLHVHGQGTTTGQALRVDDSDGDGKFVVQDDGSVGIGTTGPKSALQITGYAQLDLTTGAPPAADCDDPTEYARMKVDATDAVAKKLWICTAAGWLSATLN